jgi:PAS domain S-box-containing protein
MFSSLSEGVILQNVAGRVLRSNNAAMTLFGVELSEIIGWFSFDPKWHAEFENGRAVTIDSHPAMVAQKTGRAQTNCILQIRRPSGELRWVSVSVIPLFEVDSLKLIQVITILHDITEERESQRALIHKEREVSALMNRLPALVTYWDSNLKNVFSNSAAAASFGRTPFEMRGLHAREILGEEAYNRDFQYVAKTLAGLPQTFETSYAAPSGDIAFALASFIPNTQDGITRGFYSVITDVSQLKKLESDRRNLESKLIAASKLAALGEMAAGIAHEINNPLAIIKGKTDVLRDRMERDLFDPTRFELDLATIATTVERIAKIVRGLLAFSRNEPIDLMQMKSIAAIVTETVDLCREKIRMKGIELEIKVDSRIEFECRDHQISQILMNLINNACDAIETDKNPWLKITANVQNGQIELRVTDSGVTISPEVADKIMNPFFTTKEVGKGTGLGLSISRGLAESHGGCLSLDRSNSNTCFLLEIPLTQARRPSLISAADSRRLIRTG